MSSRFNVKPWFSVIKYCKLIKAHLREARKCEEKLVEAAGLDSSGIFEGNAFYIRLRSDNPDVLQRVKARNIKGVRGVMLNEVDLNEAFFITDIRPDAIVSELSSCFPDDEIVIEYNCREDLDTYHVKRFKDGKVLTNES